MGDRIGIAATTYNRPNHLAYWTKTVAEFSPEDAVFHIANDTNERKGVAFRSTECLRELYEAGCEYFFLFNDDCFPIKAGWCDFFIDALRASEQNHFCYLRETPGVKLISSPMVWDQTALEQKLMKPICYTINQYDNCNGCLMVMTRKAVEKAGGFNPNFGIYGFEHADYSNRIFKAGLNSMGAYLCPAGASEYIYSCDLDFTRPEIQKQLKHKSSMSPREAMLHVQKAHAVFQRPTQIHFPL